MTRYYRIRAWAEYQHYKHRDPPWIKLHRRILQSPSWVGVNDASRVLAVASMALAAGCDNKILADNDYIRRVAYLNAPPDFSELLRVGFVDLIEESSPIVNNASTMLADASTSVQMLDQRQSQSRDREEKKDVKELINGLAEKKNMNGASAKPDYDEAKTRKQRWQQKVVAYATRVCRPHDLRMWIAVALTDTPEGKLAFERMNDRMRADKAHAKARAQAPPQAPNATSGQNTGNGGISGGGVA
jgi:hypothetical protein